MSENVPGDSPAASAFGDVQAECRRVQPVIHVARTIGELGGDPQRVLAEAGIPAGLFANPDNSIPRQALGDLLERCVAVTRCQHFGLRLGAGAGGNPLGLLGDVMERCVDVGTAIAHFHQYFHLLDRSALLTRTVAGASASIGYALTESTGPGADQISDAAAAIGMGLLRRLCGAQWKPQAVLLPRQRPRDVRPYEGFLRVRRSSPPSEWRRANVRIPVFPGRLTATGGGVAMRQATPGFCRPEREPPSCHDRKGRRHGFRRPSFTADLRRHHPRRRAGPLPRWPN